MNARSDFAQWIHRGLSERCRDEDASLNDNRRKSVAAECGNQHAASVRSPEIQQREISLRSMMQSLAREYLFVGGFLWL